MRDRFSRKIAIVTALAYMLLPYHINLDFYQRCALGECYRLWRGFRLSCSSLQDPSQTGEERSLVWRSPLGSNT